MITNREVIETYLEALDPTIIYYSKRYRIFGFDWDDIAQELRLHLWLKMKHFDVTKASLKTWATHVIRNKIIDLTRRRRDPIDGSACYHENPEPDFVYLDDSY